MFLPVAPRALLCIVVFVLAAGCGGKGKEDGQAFDSGVYPAAIENTFLESCETQASVVSHLPKSRFTAQCSCSLRKIESSIPLGTFQEAETRMMNLEAVDTDTRTKLLRAIKSCAHS